jgi:hypothetical protein
MGFSIARATAAGGSRMMTWKLGRDVGSSM